VGTQEMVLSKPMLEKAMAARGNKALFLMDLGVPRNIDPAAAEIYNAYLYTVDDLTEIVQQNRSARQSEVPKAEALVEEHVAKFISWQSSVELIAVLDSLRERLRQRRSVFLAEKLAGMSHLGTDDHEKIASMMDELIERIMIEPAERMRSEKQLRRKIQNLEALRDLYLSDREKP
jgi:glutamyl-tRNA reductase